MDDLHFQKSVKDHDIEKEGQNSEIPIECSEPKPDEDDELFDDDIDWNAVESSAKNIKKCPGHSVTFPIGKR